MFLTKCSLKGFWSFIILPLTSAQMFSTWPITSQANFLIKRHWAGVCYLDQQTHLYLGGGSLRSILKASLTDDPDSVESWGPAKGRAINQHIFQVYNFMFGDFGRMRGMNRKSIRLPHWILQFFPIQIHNRKVPGKGFLTWADGALPTMTVPGKHKNPPLIAGLLRKQRLQASYFKETTWKWQLYNSSEKANKWSHDCSKWR